MKPLSEKELREKIQDIFNDCTSGWLITIKDFNGEDRSLESLENEIIDDILTLTTQDRQAWGEYVIGTSSLSMVMSPAIRLKNGHIDTSWTDEHDKYKAAYIEDGLRAEQRQRNQGEKK